MRTCKHPDPENLQTAVKLYEQGLSFAKIAPIVGIPRYTLNRHLRKMGVFIRPGGPHYGKLSDAQVAAIPELYGSGLSTTEIGKLYGVEDTAILYRMKTLGVKSRASRDACRTYTIDTNYFHDINTSEKAYWLGFLAADGCIVRGQLKLFLGRKDHDHVVAFTQALSSKHPISQDFNSKGRPQSRVQIGCYQMVSDLERHGIVARKSLTLTFPELNPNMNRHFIRGYFDGDGSIGGQRQPIATLVGTKQFLTSTAKILHTEGITKKFWNLQACPHSPIYILAVGGRNQARRLYHWLYDGSTIWLPRKREKFEYLLERP